MTRRMFRNRAGLSLALLLLLGAITAQVVAERGSAGTGAPLSSRESDPDGALALALWLEEMGYGVSRLEDASSPPLRSIEVLFLLRPVRAFGRAEAQGVLAWVREGGVLIYAPSWLPFRPEAPATSMDGLAEEMALGVSFGPRVEYAHPELPFFFDPPTSHPPASQFRVNSVSSLDLREDAWVPLIRGRDRVFAATRQLGNGRIHAVAPEALFANRGILEDDNATFVLSVLAQHPTRRAVAFEEAHHSFLEAPDLAAVARASPWGWALAYAALASFGFALWGGRRFGPALVAERTMARSSGEYVVAFAGLLQRARARHWVQAHYAGVVRRRLARLLGVRADLAGPELARQLQERRQVDSAALAEHLAALEGRPLSERDLLSRVRALERITTESPRHGEG